MGKILVVQQVQTYWNKDARGGATAVQRNAVPESETIPVRRIDHKGLNVVHHRIVYGARYGEQSFDRPSHEEIQVNSNLHPLEIGCVTLHQLKEELRATFRYNRGCAGMPDRSWVRKTLSITENEWGQIVYNGRFAGSWEGNWWYEKMVVNVGLFDPLTLDLFTREAPTYRFSAMGDLF